MHIEESIAHSQTVLTLQMCLPGSLVLVHFSTLGLFLPILFIVADADPMKLLF